MLLGVWENIEHLEKVLTLSELNKIVEAGRERDMRHWKFQASLKGIKIDDDYEEKPQETGEEILARAKRRAALKIQGITDEAEIDRKVDHMEIFDMGLDFIEG